MNVKVISIKPTNESKKFLLEMLIGKDSHQFLMTAVTDTIAGEKIQVIKGDKSFGQTFRFNQELAVKLYKMVSEFNRGQFVKLPVEIGDFSKNEIERVSFMTKV
ncbi:MAG: hypothetical protein F6K39_35795 [Okeania sp. SIO3B3]|nr:hypothetical protein [Okeania sp. SIO3B3]